MSAVFYTSDLHLGHARVSETRGFTDTAVHDQHVIDIWQHMVGKRDIVYVLGDISVGGEAAALAILESLPGEKHLVAGNHDSVHPLNHRGFNRNFTRFLDVFRTVSPMRMRKINDRRVMLSHFPYESWGDGEHREGSRFEEWRLPDKGLPLLHGHTHGTEREHGRMFHVGLDAWGGLVPESRVAWWLKDVPPAEPR